MTKRDVHGWENLMGDKTNVVAARTEVLRQLGDVPQPHRDSWEKRLKSKLDHPHFSVRLELYLHHFFKERVWEIDIEPELPGTTNRPDFLLRCGEHEMLVEARTLLDPQPVEQQDTRLKTLADGLASKLKRTVSIHPLYDLPPSLPSRHIAAEIEKKASDVALNQEFRIEGEHHGNRYALEVIVILGDKPTPTASVGATVGRAYQSDTGRRMREGIARKAGMYGKPTMPLVITVWPQTWLYESGPDKDDYLALCGDLEWVDTTSSEFTEQSKFNGVFTLKKGNGSRRYSHVSAVAIYRFLWEMDPPHAGRSSLRVYHNPWAERPLDIKVFQGIPQGIVNLNTGRLEWA